MARSRLATILAVVLVVGVPRFAPGRAQEPSDFAGRWTFSRELSQIPREIGFGADWMSGGAPGQDSSGSGGRGRRGSSGAGTGAFTARPESADDAKRVQRLTAEVRTPSAHLTIVETPTAITIANDRDQSRTFHPNGKDEILPLDDVPVRVNAKREADRLVVVYSVEQGRELRYTYSSASSRRQLVVDVQFIEHGKGGDHVRLVYEPASAIATVPAADAAPSFTPPQQRSGEP